jgi:hypothetical protein
MEFFDAPAHFVVHKAVVQHVISVVAPALDAKAAHILYTLPPALVGRACCAAPCAAHSLQGCAGPIASNADARGRTFSVAPSRGFGSTVAMARKPSNDAAPSGRFVIKSRQANKGCEVYR